MSTLVNTRKKHIWQKKTWGFLLFPQQHRVHKYTDGGESACVSPFAKSGSYEQQTLHFRLHFWLLCWWYFSSYTSFQPNIIVLSKKLHLSEPFHRLKAPSQSQTSRRVQSYLECSKLKPVVCTVWFIIIWHFFSIVLGQIYAKKTHIYACKFHYTLCWKKQVLYFFNTFLV